MQYQIGDWLVNTIERSIQHVETKELIKLEPIAIELLTLLAENSGQIVSREDLFKKVWGGRLISDHAVYRVITNLRKALSPEHKNAYIVTVSKRGYKLVKHFQLIQECEANASNSNGNSNEIHEPLIKNILIKSVNQKNILFIASCFILIAFGILMLSKASNKRLPLYSTTTPLTTKTGVEANPVYLDNKKFLFTHQKDENSPANVFLKDLTTGLVERITNNKLNEDNLTASKDGKYIAFTRSYRNECNIILLERINKQYSEKNLFECNTLYSEFSDLALTSNGDKLYYIYETAGSHQIFSHLISTGRKTQISKLYNNDYIGEISLALSPDDSKLAFIRLPNWESSIVGIIDTKSNKEKTLFELNSYIDSIAWSNDSDRLFYIEGEQSVYSYSLKKNKHQVVLRSLDSDLRKVFTSPITNSIVIHKNSNAVSRGIWKAPNPLVSENDSSSELLITSNELDIYPSYANTSNRIAFMSFRSGSQQIWIKEENGNERRITNFTDGRIIDHLNWSPDDSQILSLGNKEIYSVNTDTGKITIFLKLEKYGKIGHATWSQDAKKIYFSSDISGEMQIHSFNIETGEISKITKYGGVVAFPDHATNDIYVIKMHEDGLWKINPNDDTEVLLFEDIDQESYGGVTIKKDIIYYYSTNMNIKYYNTKTNSGSEVELEKIPEVQYFSMPHDASNFVYYYRNLTESSIVLASEEFISFIPKVAN